MTWKVVAAAVIGPDHLISGRTGDDRCAYFISPNGTMIGVVSDGAGSAICGGEGASIAVDTVISYLKDRIDAKSGFQISHNDVVDAIGAARSEVELRIQGTSLKLSDYHATILGVICDNEGGFIFHIGDGAAGVLLAEGNQIVSKPDNGEYSDLSFFFTQDCWQEKLRFTSFGQPQIIVLSTDGCSSFTFSKGHESFSSGFVDLLTSELAHRSIDDGSEFLRSVLSSDQASNVSGDDKSILWASLTSRHE